MAENSDSRDEDLEDSRNAESGKIPDENFPSVESNNTASTQESKNMETHAYHLHSAPGKKIWESTNAQHCIAKMPATEYKLIFWNSI